MERLQKKVEDLYWPNSRKVQKVDTVIENWALIINPCISLFRSNLSMSISFYEQDNNIIWNIIKTEGVAKRPPVGTALWAALFMVMIIQPIFLSLLVIRSSPLGEVVTQGCGLLCIILLASVYFPPSIHVPSHMCLHFLALSAAVFLCFCQALSGILGHCLTPSWFH